MRRNHAARIATPWVSSVRTTRYRSGATNRLAAVLTTNALISGCPLIAVRTPTNAGKSG